MRTFFLLCAFGHLTLGMVCAIHMYLAWWWVFGRPINSLCSWMVRSNAWWLLLLLFPIGFSRWLCKPIPSQGQEPLFPVTTLSTRVVSSSRAFRHQASVSQVCKVATGSSVHAFTKSYWVEMSASSDFFLPQSVAGCFLGPSGTPWGWFGVLVWCPEFLIHWLVCPHLIGSLLRDIPVW